MRRLLALLMASLLLFATAACGNDSGKTKAADVDLGEKISGLSVSGAFGAEPKVTVEARDQGRQADDAGDLPG
ncbi:hypothetical protein KRR39_08570 [Nocardioides panacis]|uniref:Uncharacterized protein n=1 Tax=Nocardioides panacis TaxID=2849501 RepID=A0A975Y1R2_9ACTN|nr:hypothetical protein [Nocardioides panacis]QWZ09773.1 hypothetical protein KRR39_08570 [Nocardioides panacis]